MGRIRDIARQIKRKLIKQPETFLSKIKGVIHVGANLGQERVLYRHWNLNVIWIEPIPEIFEQLKQNIDGFPKQTAYQYLVTDKDNETYPFNIANNQGQSSSIYDLKQHKDIWPTIDYEKKIELSSVTLSSLIENENIDPSQFDALVLDIQGSELLVLKGTGDLLNRFRYISTEAADFEAYANCCQLKDLDEFLATYQFQQVSKDIIAEHAQGGKYYEVLYQNTAVNN